MRRNGFTLIEMLIVIALAMALMTMGATAFTRLGDTQKMSIGSGAVCAALQQARAHALKTKQVTAVYFLDAGDYTTDTPSDYSTYDDADKLEFPCELVVYADGEEVNRIKMPEGISWLDANARPGDYNNSSRPYYNRACSLVINFSPAGNAWAEILSGDNGTFGETGMRTKNSCRDIRVFNVDNLPAAEYTNVHNDGKNGPFTGARGNKNPANVEGKFPWTTIHINYLTGIAEIINGRQETWSAP